MATKTLAAALAAAITVTACAAPSQPFLDQARKDCQSGDQSACGRIGELQAQVNYEREKQSEQAAAAALAIVGGLAAGAAAYGAATAPTYYYTPVVVLCGRHYC